MSIEHAPSESIRLNAFKVRVRQGLWNVYRSAPDGARCIGTAQRRPCGSGWWAIYPSGDDCRPAASLAAAVAILKHRDQPDTTVGLFAPA